MRIPHSPAATAPSRRESEGAFIHPLYTILQKNNPSVSCADSSLYTREPEFAVDCK